MDITDVIKTVAPWIDTALEGPLGGMAVDAVADALGLQTKTVDAVKQAISGATPEQLLALKQADQTFQARMQELGFNLVKDLERIAADDRDSARKANVAGGVQAYLFWLSILLLGASLGSEITLLFKGYPVGVPEIVVGRVLGLFDAIAMAVMAYWYGTTAGSAQKTELLASAPPVAR